MLIDADRAFLGKLQRALDGERPAMEIVAATNSHAEAVELAQDATPDVILLAMSPGDTDHVATIVKLCAASPARILMLAVVRDPVASARAVKAGARGVLLKDDAPEVMRKALRKVQEGELWLDRLATGRIVDDLVAARARAVEAGGALDKLTARELEVVRALLEHQGGGSRDLAARLQVSEHTLRNHFTSIYRKLGVPNRVGLFAYASRHRFDVVG
jgi:two-component system, NarL family, nitrate/nitrite response regulator NarL